MRLAHTLTLCGPTSLAAAPRAWAQMFSSANLVTEAQHHSWLAEVDWQLALTSPSPSVPSRHLGSPCDSRPRPLK